MHTGQVLTLYCAVPYIAACVDISRTVFRDHSVLCLPGKALILVAKLINSSHRYTSNLLADLLYFQWGSLGPLRMMGKLIFKMLGL